ncbi:glucuronate isomerase [Algibacillus agarilyticus]|uniref:glucuronate isomerase n=1 Tax=Algibacillus agarilyticus TaxID=2234133 RepID=UPI000DD073D8|nr:glucuronate isomerase [Algibacillus agarilyticus]
MSQSNRPYTLHADRLFSANESERAISRELYASIKDLPIVSPHGHTDPSWFADDTCFENATQLLIIPDHYVFRMLYSQGITLDELGIRRVDGVQTEADNLKIWRLFAKNYHLYHGTPSRMWMDFVLCEVFGFDIELNLDNADTIYHAINQTLQTDAFKPRALLKRFNIELIATTEGATDTLEHHAKLKGTGLESTVITTFRPDDVVDPSNPKFLANVQLMGQQTQENTESWAGYLNALKARRAFFREHGATATDHGHPTPFTADLSLGECNALFNKILQRASNEQDHELFRGQMLTEMAKMSVEDGMVMQIHSGCFRNHNQPLFNAFGADKGSDLPLATEFITNLRPLLNRFGNEKNLRIILFTLDETTYSRELAPLAGHYPCLKLGPAWWFHDSPEGMLRFRNQMTETGGFYNTVGFNDDTRAFLSIPARHDVARRIDCRFLAQLVCEHRMTEEHAFSLAHDLTYRLAKEGYENSLLS